MTGETVTGFEFYELTEALHSGDFGPRYFDREYGGELEYGDVAGLGGEFWERFDTVREIHGNGTGPYRFENIHEAELFLSLHPDLKQGEFAEDRPLHQPEISNILRDMDEHGLVEITGGGRGTRYFYGPAAHPYLYVAEQVEELLEIVEEDGAGGLEIPEDADNREILELGQELLDESANFTLSDEDGGIEERESAGEQMDGFDDDDAGYEGFT